MNPLHVNNPLMEVIMANQPPIPPIRQLVALGVILALVMLGGPLVDMLL